MSERNVEIVRRGYEAIARGDFEAIHALLDPDVKWHGGVPDDGCQNRAQTLAFMQRENRPATTPELVEIIDAGERVVVITRSRDPDDRLHANLTTFRDARVVEMVHYDAPDDALAAVGVTRSSQS
jgi:uncharacterized protein